jgi:Zinc carboxypeptidase
LIVLEISNDVQTSHLQPAIKIIGGVRGNEMVGTEIALQLANYILSHAPIDDDIERLLKGYSIHFLPALNRDGIVMAQPGNCSAKSGLTFNLGVEIKFSEKKF